MKHRKPYVTYTKVSKQEAVKLMESSDRPASEIARDLIPFAPVWFVQRETDPGVVIVAPPA